MPCRCCSSRRTAGFASLSDFANLHEASRLLLICLMFIGSAPASMGGGVTTGTISILTIAVRSFARGANTVRAGERAMLLKDDGSLETVLMIIRRSPWSAVGTNSQ